MFIIVILLILLIIVIIALAIGLILEMTNRRYIISRISKTQPDIVEARVATSVQGNADGSWFEVKDQDGDVILGVGSRDTENIDVTCPDGVALIGLSENSLGPIICQNGEETADIEGEAAEYYGFVGDCPGGYHKDNLGISDRFICVPDVECTFQVDCAPGFTCNNDKCEPIEDF
jgi:hypothetical protein